jgi:ABC-type branched-subunit amino acid transport system ATPase component
MRLKLARRAYALDAGRIVVSGTAADLMGNPRVQGANLGR